MTLPFTISADLRLPLGLGLIELAVVGVAILYLMHVRHNRQRAARGVPTLSVGQHVVRKGPHHIAALLVAMLGVAVLLGLGAAAVVILHYHGGAVFHRNRHIPPPHVLPHAGGAVAHTPNLSLYLPQPYDQKVSNSCWCQSVSAALYAAEHQARHTMPVPSPWRCFWYGAGGQDSTGTLEQAIAAYNAHGAEPFPYWPVEGPPDSLDESRTTAYQAASVRYIYYGAGYGSSTIGALEDALDSGHIVTILWDVGANALRSGQWIIDDGGVHQFYHFSNLYGYQRNADGSVSFSLRNSWGDAWGVHGDALMPQTVVLRDVLAAAIVSAGHPVPADVWTLPTATPLPRPTATRTPTPRPTATRTPTPRPVACVVHMLTVTTSTNLHAVNRKGSAVLLGLPRGSRVQTICPAQSSPHWLAVTGQGKRGWIIRTAL